MTFFTADSHIHVLSAHPTKVLDNSTNQKHGHVSAWVMTCVWGIKQFLIYDLRYT